MKLAVLFQRFWQGEPGKRYVASTGLGLYLCKRIVDLHGGSIQCASTRQAGTVFTVALPAHRAGHRQIAQGPVVPHVPWRR
ncbi:MAG TPA: ATP-binding protein [Candidatus Obscuribacterales bacterium]